MRANNTDAERLFTVPAAFRPLRLYAVGFLLYSGVSAWAVPAVSGGRAAATLCGLLFLAGAVFTGCFNAFLLERYSRKGVLLRVLVVQMAVIFGLWPRLLPEGWGRMAACCLMGSAFALQQATLASTLLNDLVVSEQRTRADLEYAWVCRGGLAAGAALASAVAVLLPRHASVCAGMPLLLAFLTALPLGIRLKAPVPVALFSFDRYFRADRTLSCAAAAVSAFPLGFLLCRCGTVPVAFSLLPGVALGYRAWRALFRRGCAGRGLPMSRLLTLAGLSLFLLPGWLPVGADMQAVLALCAGVLTASGAGFSLSCVLGALLEESAHCRRGTSQHTHFLGALSGTVFGLAAGDKPLVAAVVVVLSAVFALFRSFFRRKVRKGAKE